MGRQPRTFSLESWGARASAVWENCKKGQGLWGAQWQRARTRQRGAGGCRKRGGGSQPRARGCMQS